MTEPIRIVEGKAQPYEPFWRLVNAAESDSGEPEIEFNGTISEHSWFEDDITPQKFKTDLYRVGNNGPVTIRVNSGGGDVFAASMIRSILQTYPGRKTTRVDGIAASAAVAIVMAGDVIKIMDTGQMMIHEAAFDVFLARLDAPTLRRLAEQLDVTNASLRDVYSSQTNIPAKEIAKMMAATTWMSANDAVKMGFADEVIPGGKVRGNAALMNSLRYYSNVPAAVLAMAQEEEPTTEEPAEQDPAESTTEGAETEPPVTKEPAVEPETEPAAPEGAAQERPALEARRARLAKLIQPTQGAPDEKEVE